MSSGRGDFALRFPSPQDVYVNAYLASEDPIFDEQPLLKHIQLAGETKKKAILFFIRDELENKEIGPYNVDNRYSGKAFSTLLYFLHHNFRMSIVDNFCQHVDLASSTSNEIIEVIQTCHILNPEDNKFSSTMCVIVLFPAEAFDNLKKEE